MAVRPAIHSSAPSAPQRCGLRRECCRSHLFTEELLAQTQTREKSASATSGHSYATVPPESPAPRCSSGISARPPTLSLAGCRPCPAVGSHPLKKSPSRSPHARSPPAPVLLQGETFPRRAEKHLAVTTLFFFFPPSLHFSPSLRSISKSKNKLPPLSRWKTAVLHHSEPPLSS